jgi:NAD-dependent dihydropyrimidine dehydrogenase PreA subunit/flavodoxin
MKIFQVYHSSTGNNRLCAAVFEEEAKARGDECLTFDVRNSGDGKEAAARIAECDLFGVVTPTYYFKAPVTMIDFIERLPAFEPKPCCILNCCTDITSNTIAMLARQLQRKNLFLIDSLVVHGEETYPPFRWKSLIPKKGKPGAEELRRVRAFTKRVCEAAEKIRRNPNHVFRPRRYVVWPTPFHFIAVSASRRNMMRYMLGKRLVPDACTSCGICARECPTNSIRLLPHDLNAVRRRRDATVRRRGVLCARLADSADGTLMLPVFADTCMGCYACVNLCPTSAIYTPVANRRPPYPGPASAR